MNRSLFHATSNFSIYKNIFETELSVIREYIDQTSAYFNTKTIELNKAFINMDDDAFRDTIGDEYFKNGIHFPKILYSSVLISLQTQLEKTLKLLTERCTKSFGPHKLTKKAKGENDIDHYCRILKTAYGIDCGDGSTVRIRINEYRLLRNLFVHAGGNLAAEKSEFNKKSILATIAASEEQLLFADQTQQIVIYSGSYLIRFAQYILAMMDPIFTQLTSKHSSMLT